MTARRRRGRLTLGPEPTSRGDLLRYTGDGVSAGAEAGATLGAGLGATGLATATEAVFDPVFVGERFAIFLERDLVRLAFVLTAAAFVALGLASICLAGFRLAGFRLAGFPSARGRPSFLAFLALR
ncbi:MAG TPA: hypothetical protein VGX76_25110 [Pirellulales bacterium]|nr:hypothetical protein [Pirellulales bacterium]